MAVRKIVTPEKHIGLSSDTKPTHQRAGATFYEYDTDLMFITYDGTNWVLKKDVTDAGTWRFGEPVLTAGGKGRAIWTTIKSIGVGHNSQVTWAAKLDAGTQSSWDDFARVVIPINEMPFADLDSVRLHAYYTATTGHDMAVAVHMHDPTDFDKRVELSHTPYTTTAAGWRELNFPTEPGGISWFWDGDEDQFTGVLTRGASYTWAQFQADAVFSTWTIFKITLDYGYYTGDVVMNDCYLTHCSINGEAIPIQPSLKEQIALASDRTADAIKTIPTWTFGDPVLRSGGVSKVGWVQDTGNAIRLFQKGASGYLANLYGGVQDGDDWAAVYIPVNELPVPDLTSALWTYHLTSAESAGVNLVVWVHDPTDNIKRAEITQVMGLVDKAQYWNGHELDTSVSQFFYYGEGESGMDVCIAEGTNYTWAQYQVDAMFSTWTIYRISLEYGWIGSSTLDDAWVADVKLNGQVILLKPQPWDFIGRETKSFYKATATDATDDAVLVTPNATKRIRVKNIYITTTTATVYNYEVYFGVNANITTDATNAIALATLGTDDVATISIPFGDNGPLGEIGEVVSMRVSNNVTDTAAFIIVYREE